MSSARIASPATTILWAGHLSGYPTAATLIVAVLLTLMGGCSVREDARRDLASALSHYQQRGAADAAAYAGRTAKGAPASRPTTAGTRQEATRSPATQPATAQSLRDYIAIALAENPEIEAAEHTARSRLERVPQVTSLPDPLLKMKVIPEPVRTAEGDSYFVLGVQQKFPVPEKLDRAGRAALHEARMAFEMLQRTRQRVIADVKRAYYRLYIIDRTIQIDEANQELLRGLIDAARAQVAAGKRSQGDVLRAQVELSNLDSRLIELRQQRQTTVAALNRVMNRPSQTPVPEPPDFDLGRVGSQLDTLLDAAAKHNPQLAGLREQIARDRERVELARLAYWPDFTLGLEWIQVDPRGAFEPLPNPQTGIRPPAPQLSEEGSDNWAITVGMNLPVWVDRIRAGIREARQRLMAAQAQLAATHNRVTFEVEDALTRVSAQQELVDLFEHTIIPQARQAYEVSRVSYSAGRTDFLFVIDNWQKWLTFSIQYHRAMGELERSVADLEQALGLALVEAES